MNCVYCSEYTILIANIHNSELKVVAHYIVVQKDVCKLYHELCVL